MSALSHALEISMAGQDKLKIILRHILKCKESLSLGAFTLSIHLSTALNASALPCYSELSLNCPHTMTEVR